MSDSYKLQSTRNKGLPVWHKIKHDYKIIVPVGARFFAPVQTGPGAHSASYTMGTGSFLGVKRPGRGADHPHPSKCRGQERVGLYLYSPSGPSWPVMGAPLPLPLQHEYRNMQRHYHVKAAMQQCMSVCSHGRTRLPVKRFSLNVILEYFSKIFREN